MPESDDFTGWETGNIWPVPRCKRAGCRGALRPGWILHLTYINLVALSRRDELSRGEGRISSGTRGALKWEKLKICWLRFVLLETFFYEKIDKRDATGETRFLRQQELSNFIEPPRSYRFGTLSRLRSSRISSFVISREEQPESGTYESKSQSFGADKLSKASALIVCTNQWQLRNRITLGR
jgi:hypothetical protein